MRLCQRRLFGVAEAGGLFEQLLQRIAVGNLIPGALLIAQFLRMVTLPLWRALWAGVVGYFIGLAPRFPPKQAAIVIVGLLMMATVHGAHDTFSDSWLALVLCVLSLFLFIMYMRTAEKVTEKFGA